MITLNFWYKNIPVKQIKQEWVDLVPLLGFVRVGRKESTGSWNYVSLDHIPVFFGISERVNKHVVVDIFAKEDEARSALEIVLKKFYHLGNYTQPVEVFLVEGVEEASGPLLTLNSSELEECLRGIESPQIRVINRLLYNQLEELGKIAAKYASNPVLIKDNLWLDFGWSAYSSTWQL